MELKIWKQEIIPALKDKSQREKLISKIKHVLNHEFIPKQHRSIIWPKVITPKLFYIEVDNLAYWQYSSDKEKDL